MICASYDHNMLTFEVFHSLSFLFHFFLCIFAKTIHPSLSMRKAFSLYTYIPIHEKLFLYTHALKKTLSLYINMVYIKPLFLFKYFFFLFQHTLVFYTKVFFIYTHCSHTRISFHTLYIHTKSFHTLFIYRNSSFLYIQIWHFVHNASFFFYSWCYHDVCSFYFRTTFLNEKLYTIPEFQQTLSTITK